MEPRIEHWQGKTLLGMRRWMSFARNQTPELWRNFMVRRWEIQGNLYPEFYSVEVYPARFFEPFQPDALFEKWAAVEAEGLQSIPEGMQTLQVPKGDYAVFLHRGPASTGARTYETIFRKWLPNSEYQLDQRPHFALMTEKYKGEDPSSEEEIWIPIRPKMNTQVL